MELVGIVESFISFSKTRNTCNVILSKFLVYVFSAEIIHLLLKMIWGSFWRYIIFDILKQFLRAFLTIGNIFHKFSGFHI